MMTADNGNVFLKLGTIDFLGQKVHLDDVFETLHESKKLEIIKKTKEDHGLHFEYGTNSNIVKINGVPLTSIDIFGFEKACVLEELFYKTQHHQKNENLGVAMIESPETKEQNAIKLEAEKLKKMHVSFNGKLFYVTDCGSLKECLYHVLSEDNREKIVLAEKYNPQKKDIQKHKRQYFCKRILYCYLEKDNYSSSLFERRFIPAANVDFIFSVTRLVDMASHDDITKILGNQKDERSFNGTDFILNGVTFPKEEQDFAIIKL